MKERDVLGRAPRHRIDDCATLGRGIRLLTKGDELGPPPTLLQPHQRRRNPVERRARHDADGQHFTHRDTAGGSPTTGRTNPLAASSRRRAPAASTFRRAITIASLTLPPARLFTSRAPPPLPPPHPIPIPPPPSCSFPLTAT